MTTMSPSFDLREKVSPTKLYQKCSECWVKLSQRFIFRGRDIQLKEVKEQTYDALSVLKPQKNRRSSSMGVANTQLLRRSVSTCGFLLSDYNSSDQVSDNYRHTSIDLVKVELSGSEIESAHSTQINEQSLP